MQTTLLLLALLPLTADDDLYGPPWGANHHATDVPRSRRAVVSGPRAEYVVEQGGTMDGRNCRTPHGVWQPFQQTWESNRLVRIDNIGEKNVVNPWLSNGRNDFRSLKEIVDRAVTPQMSDKDKAMALWWQEVQYRFHYEGDNNELSSPVKVFNVYGHNTCGNDSICLAGQWKQAGLKVAPARVVGHCITQVFFDGGWHLFDGDMQSIYLLRDNETIAGEQDLVRDHDLVKRTHTQGILQPDRRTGDEWESSIFVFEGEVAGDRNADGSTAMIMTLRPGEALEWRWDHLQPIKYHGGGPPRFPDRICNGRWIYRPDFTKTVWRDGATLVENIKQGKDGISAEEGQTGTITWTMRSPYVFVGGKLEVAGKDVKLSISWDGKTWEETDGYLDGKFPSQGTARYVYHVRCQLAGSARLYSLEIKNDLQMAPLTLPEMVIGKNKFVYTDESPEESRVLITHEWVERSASRPPEAPPEALFPTDSGETNGTDFVFRWKPAADAIADYHFELSSHRDMRWPLSMSFAKLISRTADAGQARYTLDAPGSLNPDVTYFWHVRAQDGQGVWGPWSKTWSFTPRGPGVPLNVAIKFAEGPDGKTGVLEWKGNPRGRAPVAYRVYASDEKGFSVSDKPYEVSVGISKELPLKLPGNFVAEVHTTSLPVLAGQAPLTAAGLRPVNKAFYRVVAVDAAGKRSGPSDYVAAPRPFLFGQQSKPAMKGQEFSAEVATIRSLGDLRMRVVGGKETTNFWDIERPRFRIERGPAWLKIDVTTGKLTGTPDAGGKAEAVVGVTLEREKRQLDGDALKWGVEKIVTAGTAEVGSTTRSFVIDVQP